MYVICVNLPLGSATSGNWKSNLESLFFSIAASHKYIKHVSLHGQQKPLGPTVTFVLRPLSFFEV